MRVILLTALLSLPALAAERTLVLASGDCRDFDLLDVTGSLTTELTGRLGAGAMDPKLVLERLRPQPSSTVEAVRHALDTAQTQLFDGKFQPALDGVRQVQKEIERLPASQDTFKLLAQSWVLEGVALRSLNDKAGSDEAWRRLLAHDKDYNLDHDLYPPTTLKQFEQARKDAAKAPRFELSVRSATPADVLLDGKPLGKTPYKGQLPGGAYRVTLASGELRSFSHEVQLSRATELQLDLGFESAVQARRPLCIAATPANAIDQAIKLAAVAGAEQAMVVRNESPSGEAGFISVTVVEVSKGNTARVGGMKLQQAHTPQGISSLADFLVTGKYVPPVVAYQGSKPVEAPAPAPVVAQAEPGAERAAPPPEATVTASGGTPGARLLSYALIGVGAASLITGLVIYATGGSDRSELSKLLDSSGNLPAKGSAGYDRALQLLSKTDTNLNLSLGLCIGGGVVAIAGAALFLLFPPESPVHAQVAVGRDGAWAGFSFGF